VISYLLNYRFTFRSTKQHREALSKFFVVAAVGFVLNGAIMAGLTGPAGLHYLPAQLVTTGVVLIWTFLCNRFWTFREQRAR
jgi:putative flippase GtrA